MLRPEQPLAIFMNGFLGDSHGKMGYGILRFSPNPVVCVIDPQHAGKTVCDVVAMPRNAPVVASVAEARALGAEVLVLGVAPSGGLLPAAWLAELDEAVSLGLSLVNGLHDVLATRYPRLATGQFVWDIRREPPGLGVGSGQARLLPNRRLLMVGTDMACGKMSAGLVIVREARQRGWRTEFVATGQIGMTIWGKGIPLDAIKIDYACGAVEKAVMEVADHDLIVVEGQGSILHPGSSATLPLMRGTCPTHLVLCHRAGTDTQSRNTWVRIPPLDQVARLYEDIARAGGALPAARTIGIALNTGHMDPDAARAAVDETARRTGLPTTDALRFGAAPLVDALEA
ncbi:MAG: DUF1611 domain-containing protein [Lentisphaerae bacterium]|nr:DUF1611 domain-containing protein [Lentisphaerota bacterium]